VVTPTMVQKTAPATDLENILYILMTLDKPAAWWQALSGASLLTTFPNLLQAIMYGSPITNLSPLPRTFLS